MGIVTIFIYLLRRLGEQTIIYNNNCLIFQGYYVDLNGDHNNLNLIEGDDNNQSTMA